jgi:hypothetical protein
MMRREPHLRLVGAGGETPEAAGAPDARPQGGRISTRHLVVVGVLMAAVLAGMFAWMNRPAGNAAIERSTAITADELEQQYGVRIDVVGLLASGGLLELRFQVRDADKATALFGAVEDMPVLAVEGTTTVLESAKGMKHSLTLLDGAAYFFLYTNVGNAVRAGSEVSFVINGVRLPHLVVQE